jgi:hypothetical protein
MTPLKSLALSSSVAAFKLSALLSAQPAATALLSHNFLFDDEPKAKTLDSLRRKLEWIRKIYNPISVGDLVERLESGSVPDNSLVYTTDDVQLDIFEVSEEFENFGVPLAMFVPVGWIFTEDLSECGALIEAVTLIQWYEGPDIEIEFGNRRRIRLSPAGKAENVDWILTNAELLAHCMEELCTKIAALEGSHRRRHPRRSTCKWSELRELASSGVYIASHSVSHVAISKTSEVRRRFELIESKRAIEGQLGSCTSFAYPYGTRGTYDESTRFALKSAGYKAGFLTHSDVINPSSPTFELPRIFIPDVPVGFPEFTARVRGAGILHQRLRRLYSR